MECRAAADSASSSSFDEYNRFSVIAENSCENDDVIDVIGATISCAKKEKKQKEHSPHQSEHEKNKLITNTMLVPLSSTSQNEKASIIKCD